VYRRLELFSCRSDLDTRKVGPRKLTGAERGLAWGGEQQYIYIYIFSVPAIYDTRGKKLGLRLSTRKEKRKKSRKKEYGGFDTREG